MLKKDGVLVIGLDGATFDLLNPLMAAGIMPNLQRLIETGASGVLKSVVPPVTGPAWASFQTGTNPGKHGIVDFLRYQPGSYEPALINSRAIRGRTLWTILSEHNRRICAINVPLTYPPQPVNGYLISGLLTPSAEAPFAYPPGLREELLAHVPGYVIVPTLPMEIVTLGLNQFVKRLVDTLWQRHKAVEWLIDQASWDLFMVHFQATDVLQHALWDCMDFAHASNTGGRLDNQVTDSAPQAPNPAPPSLSKYSTSERDMVRQFYGELDQIIGDLVQLVSGASIIVMSDHGFGPARKRVYLNQWLAKHGYLALNASETWMRFQAGLEDSVKKLDALNLRHRWLPKDFKRGRGQLIRRLAQAPWIDWDHTSAFVFSGSTFGNLYINLAGRDSAGTVTESEYEQLRTELVECFQLLTDPDTGQSVVDQVYRREEVYTGPMVAELPDLVVRPRGGYLLETRFRGNRLFAPMPPGLTGTHRMDGIYVLSGGPFAVQPQQHTTNIVDLAPTILYLLGVPTPEWMDGRVLTECTDSDYQYLGDQTILDGKTTEVHEQSYSTEDESQIIERLQGLGYL